MNLQWSLIVFPHYTNDVLVEAPPVLDVDCGADRLDNNIQDPEFKAQVFKSFAKMRVRVEALAEHQTLSNEERVQLEAIKKAITDTYSYAHM